MLDSLVETLFSYGEKFYGEEVTGVFEDPHGRLISHRDRFSWVYYYDAQTPGTSWFYKGSFQKSEGNFFIITGHASRNIIQLGNKSSRVELCHHSRLNTVFGFLGNDEFYAKDNAYNNVFNAGFSRCILTAEDNACKNIFNGNSGDDWLEARNNSFSNIFNGGYGNDRLVANHGAVCNIFHGGESNDYLEAKDNAARNIFNGDIGKNVLLAEDCASNNIFNGGSDDDWLRAQGKATRNIFFGEHGRDVFLVLDQAFSNSFNGDDDDDVALSLAGGTFDGGPGDDFIINHLVDQKFVAHVITKGGDHQDVLIHSAFFWQTNSGEFEDYTRHNITHIVLDGDDGDDIIMPYLQIDFSESRGSVPSNIADKMAICIQHLTPSLVISDSIYDITPGLGCDVVCLTDRPAKATQTIIKGFDFSQDQLAFPNQDMADAVLPHLLKAQAEKLPTIEWMHHGHHYHLIGNQYGKTPIPPAGSLSCKIWDETRTNSALAAVGDMKDFNKSILNGVFISKNGA